MYRLPGLQEPRFRERVDLNDSHACKAGLRENQAAGSCGSLAKII